MATQQEKIVAINRCMNFFADTEGVEYYNATEFTPVEINTEYNDCKQSARELFPELKHLF